MEDLEDMKNTVRQLEMNLRATQRIIEKAAEAEEEVTATFDYKLFLTYFNRYYLEDQIADYFYEQVQCEDYDIEVGFEDNICFVTPKELEII